MARSSNKRLRKAPDNLTYVELGGPTVGSGGSSQQQQANRSKKKKTNPAQDPAPAANANADTQDDVMFDGKDDNAVAFLAHGTVKEGSILDESFIAENIQNFNATNATDTDVADPDRYKLDTPYETGFTLEHLNECFVPPTKESYTPTDESERLHFLDACFGVDGFSCEKRAKDAYARLPRWIRKRIGFLGFAMQYIVFGQLESGRGEWKIIHVADYQQANDKVTRCPHPNSLIAFVGGATADLSGIGLGEIVDHRTDANGKVLFRIQRFDYSTHDRTELKKIAAANKSIKDACLARKDQKMTLFGASHMKVQHVYLVEKVDDEEDDEKKKYGTKPFRSLGDMRKSIGVRFKNSRTYINPDHLPKEVDEVKTIETCRGAFKVKRVTVEEYEKYI